MRRLYIDGAWVPSACGAGVDVVNPATEQVIDRVPAGARADVDAAVAAARAAFPGWADTPPAARGEILAAAAALLADRAERIARVIATDLGAPYVLARKVHVGLPLRVLGSYAELARRFPFDGERVGSSLVTWDPAGVAAAITRWNYPLHQAVCKVAAALAAGCTVVLKPSELAPLAAYELAGILHDAGLPPGVFNLVSGTGPVVGEALVTHPDVDVVSFTGSAPVGRRVAALAAETVKRVGLELGGKSPCVILPDADLGEAVPATVDGAFVNSGQTCTGWSRMLVHRDQYDDAVRLAVAAARAYRIGDPLAEGTRLGPLVSAARRETVLRYIIKGEEEGARLLCGGAEPPPGPGYYVEPTVFAGVEHGMVVEREEIFGPVLAVVPYASEDEAVEIANGTSGLSAAVWAGDRERGLAFARRLRTGQVHINGAKFNHLAPFGGYRPSGLGRELGVAGLAEFLETKAMHL
jgi:NAD-dependent aldehyde dehydrogenases